MNEAMSKCFAYHLLKPLNLPLEFMLESDPKKVRKAQAIISKSIDLGVPFITPSIIAMNYKFVR